MEPLKMVIHYHGADILVEIGREDHLLGTIYPVVMEGKYSFTIYMQEDDSWNIMREGNGLIPMIDSDLLKKILKKLQHELKYAA